MVEIKEDQTLKNHDMAGYDGTMQCRPVEPP